MPLPHPPFKSRCLVFTSATAARSFAPPIAWVQVVSAGTVVMAGEDGNAVTYTSAAAGDVLMGPFSAYTSTTSSNLRLGDGPPPPPNPASSTADLALNAQSINGWVPIPLNAWTDADGDPLAKFASAGTPTFGINVADSEATNIRFNNDASPGTMRTRIGLPPDLDDAADSYLEFLCSKSGATVGDATTLLTTVYIVATGDLHDGDADAGGSTNALVGNATAKTTALLSHTITAANMPANARAMEITATPVLLGTDDLMVHETRLRYKKKLLPVTAAP